MSDHIIHTLHTNDPDWVDIETEKVFAQEAHNLMLGASKSSFKSPEMLGASKSSFKSPELT